MKTRKFCPHCGRPVVKSHNRNYVFQCFFCDEDFFRCEVYNTRQIEQVRDIRREAYRREIKNGYTHYRFKMNEPFPDPIKCQRTGYVIYQRPDRPEYCTDRETLFESIEIRTETERKIASFDDLYREIAIYNRQNPNYKFTIKTIKSSVAKHRKLRSVARYGKRNLNNQ